MPDAIDCYGSDAGETSIVTKNEEIRLDSPKRARKLSLSKLKMSYFENSTTLMSNKVDNECIESELDVLKKSFEDQIDVFYSKINLEFKEKKIC